MAGIRRGEIRTVATLAVEVLVLVSALILLACTTALAAPPKYELVEKFGPDDSETSNFTAASSVAVDLQGHEIYVIDGNLFSPGTLYKFDGSGEALDWGGSAPYISGNEIGGLEFLQEGASQVAVNSTTHTVYVTSANSIRAFEPDGDPSEFTAGPGAASSTIGGFGELAGLAVDANGFIYASDRASGVVRIFEPSGEEVTEFATEEPANLAVDSTGAVYVTRFQGTVTKFTPSPFPVTTATIYTAAPEPVDPQSANAVAIDPATDNVYITHANSSPGVAVFAADGTPITVFGQPGSDGELFIAPGIAVDPKSPAAGGGLGVYVANLIFEGSSQVHVFRPEPPAAPFIEVATVSSVSSTSATLNARINPNQVATTYRFEYGLTDCRISLCTVVPPGGGAIGGGNDGIFVSREVSGLSANTQYHYRVIAENALGVTEENGMFTTQSSDLTFALSDGRVWEQVSPPNKRGAVLTGSGGGPVQAAADGNGLVYPASGSIETEPAGNRSVEISSVLAERDASGWRSTDLTSPNAEVSPPLVGNQGEYKLFSPDLSRGVLDPRSRTLLSPEASERGPYLRENTDPPVYRALVTGKAGFANVPLGTEFGGGDAFVSSVTIENATPNLSRIVLRSKVPLVKDAPAPSLYEWSGGQLKPISVLPAADGGKIVAAEFSGSGTASLRHAISDDGSRIFWTGRESPNNHLYVRDMEAGVTARIDQPQSDALGGGEANPVFQGASADGRVVYFTDTEQLTKDASPAGNDLYRCEIINVASGCINFVDLTAPAAGSSESSEVQGMVSGLSEDGSRAYFVANGALTPDRNQFGDAASPGQPNLYLWEAGIGLRFIAALDREDRPNWGMNGTEPPPGKVANLSTANSPDGRYLAFMSERRLTDEPSVNAGSNEGVERVFRYDAVTDELDCISCAISGAAPRGVLLDSTNRLVDPQLLWNGRRAAATLPEAVLQGVAGATLYRPRSVLANGRVFFNSIDPLVPGDSNNQWDVYQYEDLGAGDCGSAPESAGLVRSSKGCVSLLSSGTGATESGFMDASVSGNDVFFLTPARLSVFDNDSELDIYDARVGGSLAVLAPASECTGGEACHPASPQAPGVTPNSAAFNGSGNVKPGRKCPKGKRKVRRGGKQRCVPRKSKKKHRRGKGHRTRADR